MPSFKYFAKRNLKAGHVVDTEYTITTELHQIDDEMPAPDKVEHRTLNGGLVTVLFHIDTMINITTDFIESDGTGTPDTADYDEFFHSVAGGEEFVFNNGSDQAVIMTSRPTRVRTGTKFNYQFQVRTV